MVIVAIKENAQVREFGLRYFDEAIWPVPGWRVVKRIDTDMTVAEFKRWEAAHA